VGTDGNTNIAYGIDGTFRLFGDDYLILKWAQTFTKRMDNNPASLNPSRIYATWERRTWKGFAYNLSYSRAGAGYFPGIGFELRKNFTRFAQKILYGWLPAETSPLLRHQIYVDSFWILRNPDSSIQSAQFGPGWDFTARSGTSGTITIRGFLEDVRIPFFISDGVTIPKGKYYFSSVYIKFANPRSGLLHLSNILEIGSFYDGWKISCAISPRWSVSSGLELSGTYQFDHIEFQNRGQELDAHIGRLRALVMLSTKLSVTAFIQINSVSNTVVPNIRIRYNPREGNDLYLVYNDDLNLDQYRGYPYLPLSNNRTLMVKYIYTF
jgi:hypothetical protein